MRPERSRVQKAGRLPGASNPRFAPNVRVVSTRDGVIASVAPRSFRVKAPAGLSFVADVLPALAGAQEGEPPGWISELGSQLEAIGIVRASPAAKRRRLRTDQAVRVAAIRRTPLVEDTLHALANLGIEQASAPDDGVFVVMDLSGLGAEAAWQLARQVQRSGCRSIGIWSRGTESFLGPVAEPGRTACWNCCRLRFADSLVGEDGEAVGPNPILARVVAENVLIAVRYPEVAAYGCVLVDDGRTETLHYVVPMPWCRVCGGAAKIRPRGVPLVQSPLVPEDLRILSDSRGGIVRRLLLFQMDGGEAPRLPHCCTAVIGPYQEGSLSVPGSTGEGKGVTQEAAVWSAIGEGIERYAASLWHLSALTFASFNELRTEGFDPRWLVLYGDAQYQRPEFPYARFDPGASLPWVTGRWLDTGDPVYVPALAAYMNFPTPSRDRFQQTTSNGLAAGASFEDAALGALYELIERDAFMLHWLAGLPARRLSESGCDSITHQALREVERLGARTELFVIDTGTQHPTVVCLGLGDGQEWPGVTIGLATHADVDIALQRAVMEHGHVGAYIMRLMGEGRHRTVLGADDVITGLDHALYYVEPARAGALRAFRSGRTPPASLVDLRTRYRRPATMESCVAALTDAGIRVAAVDVTPPDVGLAPVRVVRAVGKYLHPIHFGSGNQRLENPRLEGLLRNSAEERPHPIA